MMTEGREATLISMDIHRSCAETVIGTRGGAPPSWKGGDYPDGLQGVSQTLPSTDEVVVEATGNAWRIACAVTARGTVAIADPWQVRRSACMCASQRRGNRTGEHTPASI